MTGRLNINFVQQKSFNYSNFGSCLYCSHAQNGCLTCCDGCFDRNTIDEAALTSVLHLVVRLMSSVWETKGPIYTSHQFLSVFSLILSASVSSSSRPDWDFVGV